MSFPFLVIIPIIVTLIACAVLFLTRDRALIAISSIVLSVGLIVGEICMVHLPVAFLIVPLFLIVDLLIIHFLFYTTISKVENKNIKSRIAKISARLFTVGFIFAAGMWFIWMEPYSADYQMINEDASPIIHMWQTYWPYGLFCLLLLLPLSLGSLLIARKGD